MEGPYPANIFRAEYLQQRIESPRVKGLAGEFAIEQLPFQQK
jgi:hypothetical protein